MDNLGDTSLVQTYQGEFGILSERLADYLLETFRWPSQETKNNAIEVVVTKYHILRSACTILPSIATEERFYPHIRTMIERDRLYDEKEYALYGLARYKKQEDIEYIRNVLMENLGFLNSISFLLMKEYPDNSYMEVLEAFAKHGLYMKLDFDNDYHSVSDYFKTLAFYKNEKGYRIMEKFLSSKTFLDGRKNSEMVKEELAKAIWNNPCELYRPLMHIVKPIMDTINSRNSIKPDRIDTTGNYLNGWYFEPLY